MFKEIKKQNQDILQLRKDLMNSNQELHREIQQLSQLFHSHTININGLEKRVDEIKADKTDLNEIKQYSQALHQKFNNLDIKLNDLVKGTVRQVAIDESTRQSLFNLHTKFNDKSIELGIMQLLKEIIQKIEKTEDLKSKSVKDSVQQGKVGRPKIPDEMKKDIIFWLNRGDTYKTIREQLFHKYNRKPSVATISKTAQENGIKSKETRGRKRGFMKGFRNEVITRLVERHTRYAKVGWSPEIIKEISIALNSSYETMLNSHQLKDILKAILTKYGKPSECNEFKMYFLESGMLKKEEGWRYRIIRDNTIPKQKEKLGFLEALNL